MKHIQVRGRIEINTDPQRRCYNGCHAKSEIVWSPWEIVDWNISSDRVERRLQFWRELNDYAISQRGESARVEYRAIDAEVEA